MSRQKYSYLLFVLVLALATVLAGCGGATQETVPADSAAPLAGVEQAAPAEAQMPEAAAKPVEQAKFDLVAVVDTYLSTIPEGFLSARNIDNFKDLQAAGEVVLIDVRQPDEYSQGHFEGAINLPIRTLADNLDKIPTDKPVVVYCASGHRAAMATSVLQILGYQNVKAGPTYKDWTEANEPVSTAMVEPVVYQAPQVQPELLAATKQFLSGIPEGYLAVGDIEKFKEALANGAFLVDVREPAEYQEGHIPNAVNIPLRTLGKNVAEIPTDKPVFVYCASGHRAALATAALQTLGYTNVRSFPPGFAGWSAAGEPLALAQ